MRRSGFLGILFLGLVALVAGAVGYQAGVAANAAAAGATIVVTGGFPGLGFLLFLLFVGFVFFAVGGRRRAGWGAGHGPWRAGPGAVTPAVPDRPSTLPTRAASGSPTCTAASTRRS